MNKVIFYSFLTTKILFIFFNVGAAINLKKCYSSHALGMESGAISDNQITASSSFDEQSVGPQNARIRSEKASGAWCPMRQIQNYSSEYLQVDLQQNFVIRAIETQGRFDNGTGREFTQFYFIDYLRSKFTKDENIWIRYRNRSGNTLMNANWETNIAIQRYLDPPIIASKIRIIPYSPQIRTACLRLELYGCKYLDSIISYSLSPTPNKTLFGATNFEDYIFEDSNDTSLILQTKRGLGLLTDGLISDTPPILRNNYLLLNNSLNKINSSWIAWHTNFTSSSIQILFEFDKAKNISEFTIYSYGNNTVNLSAIGFMNEKEFFEPNKIVNSYTKTFEFIDSKFMPLTYSMKNYQSAKFVLINITFTQSWFFVTEIRFNFVNESSTIVIKQTGAEPFEFEVVKLTNFYFLSICFVLIFSLVVFFFTLIIFRRRHNNILLKLGTQSAENSFYATGQATFGGSTKLNRYSGAFITTINGNGISKHIFQNEKSGPLCGFYSSTLNSQHEFGPSQVKSSMQRVLGVTHSGSGTLSSCCSMPEHISRSLQSSLANSGQKSETPPSISEFNFPPPPCLPADYINRNENGVLLDDFLTSTDDIYIEQISTENSKLLQPEMSFQPKTFQFVSSFSTNEISTATKMGFNNRTLKSASARSYRNKPVPKPRTSAHYFNNKTLPLRDHEPLFSDAATFSESSCQSCETVPIQIARESIQIVKKVGEGKFTTIFSAVSQEFPSIKLAIKTLKPELKGTTLCAARKALIGEAKILRLIHCSNFVQFFGDCDDLSIVTELCELGNIRSAFQSNQFNFSAEFFSHLYLQIINALQYLEERDIVHGHFSPRSCLLYGASHTLLFQSHLELPDVRIASPRGDNLHAQLRFSAPEAIVLNQWSNKSDVWSFGTTFWEILNECQVLPFQTLTNAQILENAKHILNKSAKTVFLDFWELKNANFLDKNLIQLLSDCCNAKQSLRPTFLDIQKCILSKPLTVLT